MYEGSYRFENGDYQKWVRYGIGGDGKSESHVGHTVVRLIWVSAIDQLEGKRYIISIVFDGRPKSAGRRLRRSSACTCQHMYPTPRISPFRGHQNYREKTTKPMPVTRIIKMDPLPSTGSGNWCTV